MTLREMINQTFGVDLPIRGGNGNSIENAIIIEFQVPMNDYISTEYEVLNYIGIGLGIKWNLIQQELIFEYDKTYDKLIIEIRPLDGSGIASQIENYYFDITECFGITILEEQPSEEDKKLLEMQAFLDKMNEEIDKEKDGKKS